MYATPAQWGLSRSAGDAGPYDVEPSDIPTGIRRRGGDDDSDDLPHHAERPTTPPPDRWMRNFRWQQFMVNRDIIEHPIVRTAGYAFLTLIVLYTGLYFYNTFGHSAVCGRVSLPGYTSDCLMTDIPQTLPRTPYQRIARPTWADLQKPVLHVQYNGAPVDIEPRTLFRRFAEISLGSYDECICAAAYGIGVSLSAIHGEVYVSPQMNSQQDLVQWVELTITPPPRFRAIRFTKTKYQAPRHAYYDYKTASGEYHDVALAGTRSACVALCAEVEAELNTE